MKHWEELACKTCQDTGIVTGGWMTTENNPVACPDCPLGEKKKEQVAAFYKERSRLYEKEKVDRLNERNQRELDDDD